MAEYDMSYDSIYIICDRVTWHVILYVTESRYTVSTSHTVMWHLCHSLYVTHSHVIFLWIDISMSHALFLWITHSHAIFLWITHSHAIESYDIDISMCHSHIAWLIEISHHIESSLWIYVSQSPWQIESHKQRLCLYICAIYIYIYIYIYVCAYM